MNMVQAGVGNSQRLLVTGAGGFLGHHLVKYPLANGYWVRSADIRRPEFEPSPAQEFEIVDLRLSDACLKMTRDVSPICHLAADRQSDTLLPTAPRSRAPTPRSAALDDRAVPRATVSGPVREPLIAAA
jgi:nucleoside-diphosphate-sugar epimerase